MLDQMQTWLGEEEMRLQGKGNPAFFTEVREGRATRSDLAQALLERYQISHFFNDILAKTLSRLNEDGFSDDNPLTATLRENLNEEKGQADNPYGQEVHDDSRARLVGALDVDHRTWASALGNFQNPGILAPRPAQFIQGMRSLSNGPVIPLYSALAYWEWRVSRNGAGDYQLFLDAFEQLFPELKRDTYSNTDALWHLHSHAVHDDDHAQAFLRALATTQDFTPVEAGFQSASNLWNGFWSL